MNLISFIRKKAYERFIGTIRRHPITFVPFVAGFIGLSIIPFVIAWMMPDLLPNLFQGPISLPLSVLAASVYYLMVIIFFYSYFVTFYLDMWIVTNDRLVDVRQVSLFARTVAELDLYQIQDATSDVRGFWHTLFNYGDVTLQTAGSIPRFVIRNVPRPHEVRQMLLDLAAEDKRFHNK